ncbi:hypothetical protein [Nocardioides sp.]|uniref:hypothetical protein n=1 Tax=Nocardioides sp. TaxID=35761 RepID=UPI001A2EA426|nr:hypothetical protein [Nocardioides sp.]MBJ7358052.1 hypothetical protein [Nocardioides sp.]
MPLRHLRQNAVAYLALVVALSTGSAYAAERIANGSVTTKKLANNAVTSVKLKNNSVKSIDIKSGTVNSDDIGTNAVSSLEIGDSSVTTTDIQDGTLLGADIKDDTITRADINDSVVPQDADIIFSNVGAGTPPVTAQGPGLNSFQFTLPRNSKLAIEFFAGELGVDCAGGAQGQVGIYLDGAPKTATLTNVPASADAGAVQIVTQDFLQSGTHTLTTGELCVGGVAYGPTVPAERVTWTVHMLAR